MNKPTMLIFAPVLSQSGYGKHAVDVVRSIIALDKYDIKIAPIRWGATPLNALKKSKDDDILDLLLQGNQLKSQPDIAVYITIPTEYQRIGKYNIGITAGIEATACPAEWVEGLNRVDLNIVPSEHSKKVFEQVEFSKNDKNTNKPMGLLKSEKPIEVLFEGVDTEVYKRKAITEMSEGIITELNQVEEDFAFLFVGHWLAGEIGHDRKDVAMMIKTFYDAFKNKDKQPALVLKTSQATFSIMDREEIKKKMSILKEGYDKSDKLPSVYLLHGQLTDDEVNDLYNHPKVKAMVTLTKGEGFGRPLLEFSLCGKPIIASGWSGHLDFLNPDYTLLLPGKLEKVHPSAQNRFFINESMWFTADYDVAKRAYIEVFENYNKYLSKAKKMMYENKNKFSLDNMTTKLRYIIEKYVPEFAVEMELKLPEKDKKLNKTILPTLKK